MATKPSMMKGLIYDIGMHVGQDSQHYLSQGYKVVAVEANPILAERAIKKFKKYIETGQLTVLNVGISTHEGTLPFYINKRLSEWSSFDKGYGTRNGTSYDVVDVRCITTQMLLQQYGVPYYMKVDIEGFDHLCLSGIADDGEKPQYVSCEACNPDWLDIIYAKGYRKFKLISQGNGFLPIDLKKEERPLYPSYQIVKNGFKLRFQKFIPFKHPCGSSGPFGENTKGGWLSYEETKKLYEGFYITKRKPLNNVSWFDFHASL